MKNSILSISVFSLVLFSFLIQGCKKQPREPKDPCRNAVTVIATETGYYNSGHFKTGNPAGGEIYLKAANWDQYSSVVVPGRHYKIAYKEVPCIEDHYKTQGNSIREGGCVVYPSKCIIIQCLQELKVTTCFNTKLNPLDYDDAGSSASSSSGITGNSLNAYVGFSGCSENDGKFVLYARQYPDYNQRAPIWEVKAVNTNNGITCQAYFQKNVCFDLSPIKDMYATMDINVSEVIIRVLTGNGYTDYTYKL